MPSVKVYIAKKLIWYVATIFISITLIFFLSHTLRGDAIWALLSRMKGQPGGAEQVEAYKRLFGLDKPLFDQYIIYMVNLFNGNLGPSYAFYPTPVMDIIMSRLPWTIGLLSAAIIISWILGNILGAMISFSSRKKVNSFLFLGAICLNQIPYYILGLILVYFLAYTINLFPMGGGYSMGHAGEDISFDLFVDRMYHAFLPALAIVLSSFGVWMINMRSMITDIQGSDFFYFAEVKGLKKNRIIMRYAFRNALLPQVTGLAMSLGLMMNGSLLTETVFSYPGIGLALINSLDRLDYNLLQGILVLTVFAVLTANLLIELLYTLIDPRVNVSEVGE